MQIIEGILTYSHADQRYQIRYGIEDYTDGLHCGEPLQAEINGVWTDTRIEFSDRWYLVNIGDQLDGLRVRYSI